MWQTIVRIQWRVWWRGDQLGSKNGERVKKERGTHVARLCAWANVSLARDDTFEHATCRFFTGVSPMDSYLPPLHYGIFKNTFWKLLFLSLDQTPSFFKNKLWYQLLGNSRNKHIQFTWFDNLFIPWSYWFVLIKFRNNTNNKTRRKKRKFFSTQLNSL
jgi:hypothetical protein